jgi:hypothetical protein
MGNCCRRLFGAAISGIARISLQIEDVGNKVVGLLGSQPDAGHGRMRCLEKCPKVQFRDRRIVGALLEARCPYQAGSLFAFVNEMAFRAPVEGDLAPECTMSRRVLSPCRAAAGQDRECGKSGQQRSHAFLPRGVDTDITAAG